MEVLIARRLCHACLRPINRPLSSRALGLLTGASSNDSLTHSVIIKRDYASQNNEPGKQGGDPFLFKPGEKADDKVSYKDVINKHKRAEKAENEKKLKGRGIQILISGLGMVGLYAYLQYMKNKKEAEIAKKTMSQVSTTTLAHIGGDWSLTNQDGVRMSSEDFLGKWTLMYFGFTHCPDICPDELEKIAEAVDIIDNNKSVPNITPLFVTVDPERDSPEAIKTYLEEFSTKMIGLTGTKEEINKTAKAFRVYHSFGPKDEDNDYIVDHTIITYLISPEGIFLEHYGRNINYIEMARKIEKRMNDYEAKK